MLLRRVPKTETEAKEVLKNDEVANDMFKETRYINEIDIKKEVHDNLVLVPGPSPTNLNEVAKGYSDEEIDTTKEVAEKVNHKIQTARSEENLICYNCESMSKVKTDQESRKQAIAEAKNQQNCDVLEETDSKDNTDEVFDKDDVEGIETKDIVINELLNVSYFVEDKSKN